MLTKIIRGIQFLERFFIGVHNFGFNGALKVFFRYRSKQISQPDFIILKKIARRFYFRGAADRGVISHFYKEGYRINDTSHEVKVRCIIDAGANIGDETIRFRYFHPEARIIAIEAEPGNFALLQKNTAGDANIFPINKGLWSKECRLKVIPGSVNEDFRVSEVAEGDPTFDIFATSIDRLIQQFALESIDILKLDIEGAEREVFGGSGANWFSRVKVFIIECPDNDKPGTTAFIYDRLKQAGLNHRTYIHGENIILIRADIPWTLKRDLFLIR